MEKGQANSKTKKTLLFMELLYQGFHIKTTHSQFNNLLSVIRFKIVPV